MVTFKNDFHGTEYTTRKREGDRVSPRTERRMRKALCAAGCECSHYGGVGRLVSVGDYYLEPHCDYATGRVSHYTIERADW